LYTAESTIHRIIDNCTTFFWFIVNSFLLPFYRVELSQHGLPLKIMYRNSLIHRLYSFLSLNLLVLTFVYDILFSSYLEKLLPFFLVYRNIRLSHRFFRQNVWNQGRRRFHRWFREKSQTLVFIIDRTFGQFIPPRIQLNRTEIRQFYNLILFPHPNFIALKQIIGIIAKSIKHLS
jgi:hypothetical protein